MRSPPLLRYFPSYQHTTVVCGGGGLNKYQRPAADTGERGSWSPGGARYRSPVRLRPGVCYDFQCQEWATDFFAFSWSSCPASIGRAGARKKRRLILLLSVGGLPLYLRPSGACLARGTRVSVSL